jgi:NAD(P)-dependent dehydrogenase (short-subunit alcohol dehydrogenase family)
MRKIAELQSLTGRKALVTGGAGHVALAVEETLMELGADLMISDKDVSTCRQRAEYLTSLGNSRVLVSECDLTDPDAVRSTIRQVPAQLGGLDILVHCAAMVAASRKTGWSVPFDQQTVDAWEAEIRIELTAAFVMAQEARASLEATGRGSVIFFGSIYGFCGPDLRLYEGTEMGNPLGYGVAKGGVIQMTRYLATMLAPRVRVNVISPGGVSRNQPTEFVDRYSDRTPMGRMATEEDLKGAVAYLASDMSTYVTGQNLIVDGGWGSW